MYVGTQYVTAGVGTVYNDAVYAAPEPVQVATPLPALSPAGVATTYRATTTAGVLDWADTPAGIISTLSATSGWDRDQLVGRYLGRSVAGAWELIYERSEPAGDATILLCRPRGTTEGEMPVVALVVETVPADLQAGRVLIASGRIAEVTLNDPGAPGGVLILDNVRLAP